MAAVAAEGDGNRFIAIAVETSSRCRSRNRAKTAKRWPSRAAGCAALIEVIDAPQIEGAHTLGVHRVLQTVVQGKPRTGELYDYSAHFGDYQVIVIANPLVVPDQPVASRSTPNGPATCSSRRSPRSETDRYRTSRGRNWMLTRGPAAPTSWVPHAPRCVGTSRPSPADRRAPAAAATTGRRPRRPQRERAGGAEADDRDHGVLACCCGRWCRRARRRCRSRRGSNTGRRW